MCFSFWIYSFITFYTSAPLPKNNDNAISTFTTTSIAAAGRGSSTSSPIATATATIRAIGGATFCSPVTITPGDSSTPTSISKFRSEVWNYAGSPAKDRRTGQQEILFLVGRKNGKTPLVSAICLAEYFCGEKGTKILCSSNDYDQADLSYQAINAMREQSPSLERLTRKNIKGIYFGNPKKPKKHGKFSFENHGSVRKISVKTGAKEGKNIKVGMIDEAHELADNTSIMPIRQALSTQWEPLYFELTTEGFVNDGYLDGRLKEAREVLTTFQDAGEITRPRWLIWLYTQDTESEVWQDE